MSKVNDFSKKWNPFDPRSMFATRGLKEEFVDPIINPKQMKVRSPEIQALITKRKEYQSQGKYNSKNSVKGANQSLLSPPSQQKSQTQAKNALPTKYGGIS